MRNDRQHRHAVKALVLNILALTAASSEMVWIIAESHLGPFTTTRVRPVASLTPGGIITAVARIMSISFAALIAAQGDRRCDAGAIGIRPHVHARYGPMELVGTAVVGVGSSTTRFQ
jgi:hypothetical protein